MTVSPVILRHLHAAFPCYQLACALAKPPKPQGSGWLYKREITWIRYQGHLLSPLIQMGIAGTALELLARTDSKATRVALMILMLWGPDLALQWVHRRVSLIALKESTPLERLLALNALEKKAKEDTEETRELCFGITLVASIVNEKYARLIRVLSRVLFTAPNHEAKLLQHILEYEAQGRA